MRYDINHRTSSLFLSYLAGIRHVTINDEPLAVIGLKETRQAYKNLGDFYGRHATGLVRHSGVVGRNARQWSRSSMEGP